MNKKSYTIPVSEGLYQSISRDEATYSFEGCSSDPGATGGDTLAVDVADEGITNGFVLSGVTNTSEAYNYEQVVCIIPPSGTALCFYTNNPASTDGYAWSLDLGANGYMLGESITGTWGFYEYDSYGDGGHEACEVSMAVSYEAALEGCTDPMADNYASGF